MKELLERLMADAKRQAPQQIEIALELTSPINKQLEKDLKEFGETTPQSIAVCLITQLEREGKIRETLNGLGHIAVLALPPDELKQFKSWQDSNIKLLRAAIKTCIDMIGE